MKNAARTGVILCAVVAAACGGSKPGPGPTSDPPQITCPADVSQREVPVASLEVTYPAPTTTGGTAPVTVTCSPASGARFTLGTTTVACAARDAQSREATCSFRVTLTGFTLGAKKFVAMGDSLTEGENGRPSIVDAANAYPTKLQALLQTLYPDQGITVINRGVGSTTAEQMRDAVRGVVQLEKPDALLLMSGYNNLFISCRLGEGTTAACGRATEDVEFAIRDSIRRAKEAGMAAKVVFVSTLVPPGPTGSRRIDADAIVEANRKIRRRVAEEGATLVDSHPLFQGREAEFVSPDGLHLNPPGYQAIADAYFNAIRLTIPQIPQLR